MPVAPARVMCLCARSLPPTFCRFSPSVVESAGVTVAGVCHCEGGQARVDVGVAGAVEPVGHRVGAGHGSPWSRAS